LANDGTVKIGTALDSSGFKSGLSGLGSFASKGFSAVGGAAKAMASVTVGALAAVASGMGAAVVSGVKYNAAMENYTANFKTMLGSEEAAVKKVNELKVLGAKTPFEMSDLATATTTLLAFGVQADKSTDILTMLGDVSLGNTDKLNRLSNSFGKVQSQGKLTGETAQMMIEAGFNPLKVIAETTGESMDALSKRMSKGGVSADEVTAAFKKATAEGGQFYKGMETASTTFDGLISTLKDNANSLVGEVVKPISDSMTKTLLPEAIGMIQSLTDGFAKDGIPGLIDAAGGVVSDIISKIAAGAPQVISMASGFLTTLLDALISQLPALSEAAVGIITELANAIIANMPLLFTLGITILTNLITGIASALPQLIPAMQTAVVTMVQTLMDNLPMILTSGAQILMSIIQGIVSVIPQLMPAAVSAITMIVMTIADNLPAILAAGMEILAAVIQGIGDMLPELIPTIIECVMQLLQTLYDNLPLLIEAGMDLLLNLAMGIVDAIPLLIEMLPQVIESMLNYLKRSLPTILQAGIKILIALINGIVDAIPQLIDMLPEIITSIVNTLIENLPLIIQAAIQIIIALITGLIQAIPSLVAAIPKIIFAMVEAFQKTDWGAVGKNILDGIKNGIQNAAGSLASAAKEAANKAIQGVKDFLGIRSPSKKARDEIGKQIPAGAAEGVDDNADVFAKSSANASRKALKAMQNVSAGDMVQQMQGQAISRSRGFSSGSEEKTAAEAVKKATQSSTAAGTTVKTGPETIVLPVYIGDQLLEEFVVTATENYEIKKNR